MENIDKLESGFKIKDLLLVESSFYKTNDVTLKKETDNNFNINVEVSIKDKTIFVLEEVVVIQKFQDIEQFRFRVKMVGIFECTGDSNITDFNEFGRINGSAIIFPYVREHITNISLKAGLGAIILPPVNFTKISEVSTNKS